MSLSTKENNEEPKRLTCGIATSSISTEEEHHNLMMTQFFENDQFIEKDVHCVSGCHLEK